MEEEFERVEEEVVEGDYGLVEAENGETIEEEFTNIEEREDVISLEGYERFKSYTSLYQSARYGLRGFVVKSGDHWYLAAVPSGEPVLMLEFETALPRVNTYIKIVKHISRFHPEAPGKKFYVIHDWEYAQPELNPPLSIKNLQDAVLDGIDFSSDIDEKLYFYHLISAPLIMVNTREYFIGGSRLALYGRASHNIVESIMGLKHYMYKSIVYQRDLYGKLSVRKYIVMEKIASKDYEKITKVNTPVESVGLVKRTPSEYYLDPDTMESIFYYKVIHPILFLQNDELIHKEEYMLRRDLKRVEFIPSIRRIIDADLESLMLATLRLSTAIARSKKSISVGDEELERAHYYLFEAIKNLSSELGNLEPSISQSISQRDIVWMVEKYGSYHNGTTCMSEKELVRRLMEEYKYSKQEAFKKIERALRSYEIFKPRLHDDMLCLV